MLTTAKVPTPNAIAEEQEVFLREEKLSSCEQNSLLQ